MRKLSLYTFASLAFLLMFSFQACNNDAAGTKDPKEGTDTTKKDTIVENTPPEEKPVEIDKKYNDVARILAGMPIDSSSEYYEVTQTTYWQSYSKAADAGWASADKKRFNSMREWSQKELADLNQMEGDLFYPFSGPDIYYGYQFFPTAKNYHLFALEPAGNLSFFKSNDVKWQNYCIHVQQTIDDFILGGFFHTKHMRVDMKDAGVLPTLLVFLVRSGNTIAKVEPIEIKADGSVGVSEKADFSSVRVDFLDATTNKLKSLYYHSCDISDEGFVARPALKKHVEQVAVNRTFTKSASYLMHRSTFKAVKEIIIANAAAVFQDDTAIPYQFYKDATWDIRLYGKYSGPIKLFAERYQNELRDAYQKKEVGALPFSLGYHSSHDYDNMMVAIRKK
jgi:hypothetical protein